MNRLRAVKPITWVIAFLVFAVMMGSWWNLPCTDAWSNDEVSPRASTLGAVFETWIPGHYFRYPPLHVLSLTILQSPLILIAGLRVGFSQEALAKELILPGYMTISCVIGRIVALVMAAGIVLNVCRLWSRIFSERTGIVAACLVAANPIFVYFAHAASVDVPYWFWVSWALVEFDQVASGKPHERKALLLSVAAVLTKDQAAFLLIGAFAVACVLLPIVNRSTKSRIRALWNPRLAKAMALATLLFLIVSGALVNPSGFRAKLAFMHDGNVNWVIYERSLHGLLEQGRDILLSISLYGSRLVALLVPVGLWIATRSAPDRMLRYRRWIPAASGLTYFFLFVIPSRWTMERHLLPLSVMFFPYGGCAFLSIFDFVSQSQTQTAAKFRWFRASLILMAVVVVIGTVLDVASVDATLIFDSRSEATAYLKRLPAGTSVEVYGGSTYLPHLPSHLTLTRVGPEDIGSRSPLPYVADLKEPFLEIEKRSPEYLVVDDRTVRVYVPKPGAKLAAFNIAQASNLDGRAFFWALENGTINYSRVLQSTCDVPWPLECKHIHLSTGSETWIFQREPISNKRP